MLIDFLTDASAKRAWHYLTCFWSVTGVSQTKFLQQVVQTQQAHPSEVSLRITTLETNLTPLLRDAAAERRVRAQLLPQLGKKNGKKSLNQSQ